MVVEVNVNMPVGLTLTFSLVKNSFKSLQIHCHQWLSGSSRVHQSRFPQGLGLGGAHYAPQTDPLVG